MSIIDKLIDKYYEIVVKKASADVIAEMTIKQNKRNKLKYDLEFERNKKKIAQIIKEKIYYDIGDATKHGQSEITISSKVMCERVYWKLTDYLYEIYQITENYRDEIENQLHDFIYNILGEKGYKISQTDEEYSDNLFGIIIKYHIYTINWENRNANTL